MWRTTPSGSITYVTRPGMSPRDRKSTRLNSSHSQISYAVFCLKKKTEAIVDLKPRDTFLLYTDGLFGSRKGKEPRLTPQRLGKMLDHSAPSSEAMLGRILAEPTPAKGEKTLPDDVAALAVHRIG